MLSLRSFSIVLQNFLPNGNGFGIMGENNRKYKVKPMKRLLALMLCLAMVLTVAAGCNKNVREELTDSRIADDVVKGSGNYAYTHVAGTPSLSDFAILSREEKEDRVFLSLDATADFSNAQVTFKASMEYVYVDNRWKVSKLNVTERAITITGAPDTDSVLNELENYVSVVGSAYAVLDEKYEVLYGISVYDATAEMQYEEGADTAVLKLSYTSDALSYEGSYALTFGENGWAVETKKQDDGRHHPLLRLTKLEKK